VMIDQSMDFARPAAALAPDRLDFLPPFPPAAERWALMCELSRHSSSGTAPRTHDFLDSVRQMPRALHLL
jgi:hypothetical protein